MQQIRDVAASLAQRLDKINFIVSSCGYLTLKGRDESPEGLDRKLACNFYARFRFVHDLLPLVDKAAQKGEHARVLSVLGAGGEGPIDLNDMGLVKNYSLNNAKCSAMTYTDAAMEELSARYPKVAFYHSYPGGVNTPMTNSHWSLSLVSFALKPFMVSPQDCAEYMWSPILNSLPEYATGAHRFNNHGDLLKPNRYLTPEVKKSVWDHAVAATSAK